MASRDISAKITQNSAAFLKACLADQATQEYFDYFGALEVLNLTELMEDEKKVFWINVYNGLVQLELNSMQTDKVEKSIFKRKSVRVANHDLSLDDIEHGILRGNYWKYGFGFIPGGYLKSSTKNWKIKKLDPRVHFQLNCGASSCPIIRVLSVQVIQYELTHGESDYILNESKVNKKRNKIHLSGLFLFYLKDFGGMKGIRRLVKKYFPDDNFQIKFSAFDWTKSSKKIHY